MNGLELAGSRLPKRSPSFRLNNQKIDLGAQHCSSYTYSMWREKNEQMPYRLQSGAYYGITQEQPWIPV